MINDRFGRTINYLRISVTDKCNYRCIYCMPGNGVPFKPHSQVLRYEEISGIATAVGRLGFTKVRFTGGEPLVKKNIEYLVGLVSRTGFYEDISMTTNGSLLTKKKAVSLKGAGLRRVNISLDTLDPKEFARITRGGDIGEVFSGIDAACAAGLYPVKLNMIVFPETTMDEYYRMREFCDGHGLILQTIRHFSLHERTTMDTMTIPIDRPQCCESCNRLRLTCDGYFKSCLFSDLEIKVDLSDIESSLRMAVWEKPRCGISCKSRTMSQIGG